MLLLALLALVPTASSRTLATSTVTVQVIGAGRVTTSDGAVNCGYGQISCHVSFTTPATLTANDVAAGWTFDSWSGDCSSDPCTVPADGSAHFVTATYSGPPTPESTLSVAYSTPEPPPPPPPPPPAPQADAGGVVEGGMTSSNDQINCGTGSGQTDCTWSAPMGSTLTVEETPDSGTVFSGWGGACTGTNRACTTYLSSDRFVSAAWVPASGATHLLTVTVVGGGKVTGGGINCPGVCSATVPAGSTVTLTATAFDGFTFSGTDAGWSGDCSGESSTCSLAMTADHKATATFVPVTSLAVAVVGNGNVSGNSGAINCGNGGNVCGAKFTVGQTATLVATPATGATFVGWTGACGGSTTTCTIAMSESKSVTATFLGGEVGSSFTLSVTVTGNGTVNGGGISCTSTGGTCTANETPNASIALTAVPASGATFSGWGGACAGITVTTCTVSMTAAKSVSATFSGGTSGFQLTVTVAGNGTVTGGGISCGHGQTRCSATETANASVTLTATPVTGATFKNWGGSCSGTSRTCTVTMSAAKTVSATFSTTPVPTVALTISVTGPGTVSTSAGKCTSTAGKKKVCAQKVTKGAKATLTEAPAKGAHLVAWGGACKVKTATCSLTMTAPKSVTVTFAAGAPSKQPPPKGQTVLKSLHKPIVHQTKSGFAVTVQFQTTLGGVAHVRGLRAGRLLATVALKVAAGPAKIGPFPVAKPGLYTFQVVLGKHALSWTACLGRCGSASRAPAFQVVREAPTATHSGDIWSVTLHLHSNYDSVARVRAYRGSKLLVDRHFLSRAGKITVGPFLLAPGKYTLRFDATDPFGRTRHVNWIVALAT